MNNFVKYALHFKRPIMNLTFSGAASFYFFEERLTACRICGRIADYLHNGKCTSCNYQNKKR